VLGSAWIVASDRVVEWVFAGEATLLVAQTLKGLLYIGVTALLVYWLATRAWRKTEGDRAWFRALFETRPDAVFVVGPEGRFVEANQVAVERYGYSRAELLGMRMRDLAPPEERDSLDERIEQGRWRPVRFGGRHVTRDGRTLEVDVAARPLPRDGERSVVVVAHDVSPLKRTEARLRESEQLQRAMVAGAPLAVYSTDPAGRTLAWNPAAEEIFGWKAVDVIGTPPPLASEDGDETFARLQERALEGESFCGREIVLHRKDGSRLDARVSIAPVRDDRSGVTGVVGAIEDVTEERRVAAALSENQRRMATLLDNLPGMAYRCRLDPEWTMRFVSEGARDLTGHRPEDLVDNARLSYAELIHPDDRDRVWKVVRKAVDEERPFVLEYRIVDAHGVEKWVWERGCAVNGGDSPAELEGFVTDITERKRGEQTLQESEARFRSLVEGAPDAVFVQTGGRFAYVNDTCARLLGARVPEDLLGREVLARVHPDDRESVRERIRRLNEDREPVELVEETFLTLADEPVPVEASATPIEYDGERGALVFVRDVRERKEGELERERLQRAIEQAGEAVVLTDTEGTIEYVNPAFERISGFSRDETIGENPRIQKSDEQDEPFYREMWETIIRGETWEGRVVNRRKDGTLYTAEVTISPVRDERGTIVNYVAVERDISREIELEEQLLQAQKMESVGRLAGGLAHDFNNMLTVVTGHVEMALETVEPGDPVRSSLEEIRNAARRSTNLIGQLLSFARRQIIAPRVVDLDGAIDRRLEMLARLIGENIDLVWRPGGAGSIKIDPARLDQVLTNLMVNARDAIEGVGKVVVETGRREFDEEYCAFHVGFIPGRYAMLEVSDTGVGMDRETLERIFEPFFTTKPAEEGTGLGLSTVYGIVRQHEGFLNVYSEPGGGTTFRIYLPHVTDEETVDEDAPEPEEASTGGTETVLVVEDEPALLALVTGLLERLGYTVISAETPEEAIRIAEGYPDTIELLLTDVVMPGMNGRELCETITGEHPDLACLYMSGYAADIVAHQGELDEDVHFLPKPFSLAELARAVREALEG